MVSEDGSPITNIHIRPKWRYVANWEYFEETFNSYAVLIGYRTVDAPEPTIELAALKYALPKETRLVLKTPYRGVKLITRMIQHKLCGNKICDTRKS